MTRALNEASASPAQGEDAPVHNLDELRQRRAWLAWEWVASKKQDGKPRKVPVYAAGPQKGRWRNGEQNSPDDLASLATFDQAQRFAKATKRAGVGLALRADLGVVCLDFDNVVQAGAVDADVAALVQDTYAEFSPSGNGVRAIVLGELPDGWRDRKEKESNEPGAKGFETFVVKGFVTITGNELPHVPDLALVHRPGHLGAVTPALLAHCGAKFGSATREPKKPAAPVAPLTEPELERLRSALTHIAKHDKDVLTYTPWRTTLMAIHEASPDDATAHALAHEFSAALENYDADETDYKLASFTRGKQGNAGAGSVFKRAFECTPPWQRCIPEDFDDLDATEPLSDAEQREHDRLRAERMARAAANDASGGPHPLARFVPLDDAPRPPRMVVPGFIQAGLVVIAGQQGAGKTTALVPLAMTVAGLHEGLHPLGPKHWRHVVYIAEDVAQVQRIVAGMVEHGGLGITHAEVRERFHLVAARRMSPEEVAKAGPIYRKQFTRTVAGVELPPLVVIDTRSATIEVADENDNAEAGRVVSLFKQHFDELPLWLVGHLAKAQVSRTEVRGLSSRGAGGFDADAHQTLFLLVESDPKSGERRYLALGKLRFEPRWTELEVQSRTATVQALDEFGDTQELTLRWGVPIPPTVSRSQARERAKEVQAQAEKAARMADDMALQTEVCAIVEAAWQEGLPLNRTGVKARVSKGHDTVARVLETLVSDRRLHEVDVPAKERRNANSKCFLVCLTDSEREAEAHGAGLPPAKLVIPESWRKSAPPPAPTPAAPAPGA